MGYDLVRWVIENKLFSITQNKVVKITEQNTVTTETSKETLLLYVMTSMGS